MLRFTALWHIVTYANASMIEQENATRKRIQVHIFIFALQIFNFYVRK